MLLCVGGVRGCRRFPACRLPPFIWVFALRRVFPSVGTYLTLRLLLVTHCSAYVVSPAVRGAFPFPACVKFTGPCLRALSHMPRPFGVCCCDAASIGSLSSAVFFHSALLLITKAFRTVSTEALQDVSGVTRVDLTAELRTRLYHHRRDPESDTAETLIRSQYLEAWQHRWTSTDRGSHTCWIWPNVSDRLAALKHVRVDFFLTQAYTGHGRFNGTLCRLGIIADDQCRMCYGDIDTPSARAVDVCICPEISIVVATGCDFTNPC